MKPVFLLMIMITLILVTVSPAIAQDNPYRQAGEIKKTDVGIKLDSENAVVSNTSKITFKGAEYTHTLGRASIRMKPLLEGIDDKVFSYGNMHRSGAKNQIQYSIYKNLIKEEITLQSPETIRYSYDLWLSDWVIKTRDKSELKKKFGGNKSKILSKLSKTETILYAKDSSIDIKSDPWGNLVIYVNDHDIVVLPRPYAIDAKGKRYDLEFALDKENKIITITGNLTGAQYPVIIDPTERVTNGNFETGDTSGWSVDPDDYEWFWESFVLNEPYPDGPLYFEGVCGGPDGRKGIWQSMDLTNVDQLTFTTILYLYTFEGNYPYFCVYIDDTEVLHVGEAWDEISNYAIDVSNYTGIHTIYFQVNGMGTTAAFNINNISAIASDQLFPPVANFSATPLSGSSPLNVSFTDASAGSPTSWNWSFGDGGTSNLQNPSHVYTMAGTYTVSLTATNTAGSNTTVRTNFITVTSPVTCDATGPYIDFVIENVSCPERNSGSWYEAVCVDNAMIRWALAGKSTPFYSNLSPWMWKRNPACPDPGHSWAVDSPYNKPIYFVSVVNSDTANVWYHHHAVAAEYLGTGDIGNSTWQDWKFFNYDDLNITIGPDHQIPSGTSISNTTVTIKNITGVYGCGQGIPSTIILFSIDQNNSISAIPVRSFVKGYIVSEAVKAPFKAQNIPDDLKNTLRSIKDNGQFSVSKWEFDLTLKKLTVYAYDIKNLKAIADIQRKTVGPYPIRIVHDLEFEKTRADVRQQLTELKKNPDYQISWIFMNIDTINDPPENYVELWVNSTTPENKMLDNSVIKGWKILVYPISQHPAETSKAKMTI